jgi:hypothetical protein
MSITLDEIIHHEERLRREIAERECLLAALKVMHAYVASSNGPQTLELGALGLALMPSAVSQKETPATLPTAVASLPEPQPERPYMHPELRALTRQQFTDTRLVAWAIQRMTTDFTLRDIAALLEREGARMRHEKISVVLTRMKNRGQIHEVQPGRGRTAAVFRQPISATPPCETLSDTPAGTPLSADAITA